MITDSFHAEDTPIIGLKDFYGEQRQLAELCIITFSTEIFRELRRTDGCEQIAEIGACNGNIPIFAFPHGGRRVAFYLSPIGSALAAEGLLEANWLTGAEKFIMFGSAGSLDREKTANRFVVPTEAYRDEGMSYHYAPPADYISVGNSAVVSGILRELNVPVAEGRVWTTDAILRETVEQMAKRKAEGCIAVDMEIAGVQAVCDFHGLSLYTFLVTGDVLSEDSYSLGTLSDANHNVDKLRLALEIAKRV